MVHRRRPHEPLIGVAPHRVGFHPERFRLACFALLAGGIALGSALAWRLSRSGAFTLLFVTLFSYHAYLSDLYFNSGAIYDLLCFLFYFGALFWYAGIRRALRSPTWPETAGIALLALLAMTSKQMAVTLPSPRRSSGRAG
ncbi:MAG: hypothetical protein HY858_11410 [Candidatus Solibacter usitatus]|nr:hypothetical protein [Candidatus Solibacter usitatus]